MQFPAPKEGITRIATALSPILGHGTIMHAVLGSQLARKLCAISGTEGELRDAALGGDTS